jgi:uncharacterized protein (DUF1800 family)
MTLPAATAQQALIAFQRFGLGARPGGPGRIAKDPKAALVAELQNRKGALIQTAGLPTYGAACFQAQSGWDHAEALRQKELAARIDKQMEAEVGFVERLVMFWSNHFSMTVNKDETIRGTIGQWERDVIRKNVLGHFGPMLRGTIQHPAMLAYLDNADSIGPNSKTGKDWGAGYNENLGRELMELHTIGSGGGYTETDVTQMAKILTGWSFVRAWESDGHYNGGTKENRGRFIYRYNWHEPGPITLMGKTYPPTGMDQAIAVLDDLAAHPATAEHIAFKLVRHFITDEPTPAMVDKLKDRYLATGGNLVAVYLALINLPEAWTLPLTKLRTPYEMSIAQFRALGRRYKDDDTWAFSEPLNALYNMVWEAPSPEGYSDDSATWLNPDAMRIRIDVGQFASWQLADDTKKNPVQLANSLFDSALSQATRERLANCGSNNNGLTVLFSCPEFQRR